MNRPLELMCEASVMRRFVAPNSLREHNRHDEGRRCAGEDGLDAGDGNPEAHGVEYCFWAVVDDFSNCKPPVDQIIGDVFGWVGEFESSSERMKFSHHCCPN